jgi:hypothetical protein
VSLLGQTAEACLMAKDVDAVTLRESRSENLPTLTYSIASKRTEFLVCRIKQTPIRWTTVTCDALASMDPYHTGIGGAHQVLATLLRLYTVEWLEKDL